MVQIIAFISRNTYITTVIYIYSAMEVFQHHYSDYIVS